MAYKITPVEVWVGAVQDRPGGLAEKLEEFASSGEDLDFMLAMRNLDMPGTGVLLISPLESKMPPGAANQGGLSRWTTVHSLRIEGPDEPGLGAKITRAVGNADISIRGASAARIGDRAVLHLAFDSQADAETACTAIGSVLW